MEVIHMRRATENDCLLFFHWKNDPVTLANSFQSDPVSLESHISWFNRALQNKSLLLLVGETSNGIPVGQVRFDTHEHTVVVGITVAPEFRGQKLGAPLLKAGCDYYRSMFPANAVDAFIKTENTASLKIFAAVGFEWQETTTVSEHPAIRMTLFT